MKTRFTLIITALTVCSLLCGQVHISIDDPRTWSADVLSPYKGQVVIFDEPMVVCANANGNYIVSPWRRFEPQNQGVAGTEEYNETVRVNSTCMFSLSGVSGYHRCGEKIYNLKAQVDGSMVTRLEWQGGTWYGNTRSELENGLPDLGDYRLLVCGFNVENYFMTLGSMGAKSESDRQKQRTKVSKALKQINADIFGLVELQMGNDAVGEIASDLNKNIPGRNYKFFRDASEGTFQKVEFVYDSNKVAPIGTPVETNVEVQNRKKLVCFRELATGEKFIYSINHFKAMNTGGADRRENEARAVMKLYNSYRMNASIRDNDLLIMGDLNTYAKTEPIFVFLDNGMIDLHRAFHADSSYSYMYGGMASYIDHAISSETMYRQITGMSPYHINSDEDDKYTYDKSSDNTMFRCSDHDPVLVGLKLDSTQVYDPTPQVNSLEIITGESTHLTIVNAHAEGKRSFYAIYSVSGTLLERKEITSAFYQAPLPMALGVYIVCIYYDGQVYQRRIVVR